MNDYKVIGFNLTAVSGKRGPEYNSNVNKVSTNIEFVAMEKEKLELLDNREALKISFKYTINHEPKQGTILIEGNILVSGNEDLYKNAAKEWKKKELPEDLKIPLFNLVLKKCNVRAFQIEEELNLPLHIKLPKIVRSSNQ